MKRCMIVLSVFIFSFVSISSSYAFGKAKVKKGKTVQFNYTLRIDDKVVESTIEREPLEYTHGSGEIVSGLSDGLSGMREGEKKIISVKPEEGYGVINLNLFKSFPRSTFPEEASLMPGTVLDMKNAQGDVKPAFVLSSDAESVVLNFNHPFAGKTLIFDVEVVSIK